MSVFIVAQSASIYSLWILENMWQGMGRGMDFRTLSWNILFKGTLSCFWLKGQPDSKPLRGRCVLCLRYTAEEGKWLVSGINLQWTQRVPHHFQVAHLESRSLSGSSLPDMMKFSSLCLWSDPVLFLLIAHDSSCCVRKYYSASVRNKPFN